ncbi:MAG: hypothetical protein AAFQ53_12250 [Bacteroidota bacterium]
MGQQQLLLLVLGIVIVGLAVVSGIETFDDGFRKSRKDNAIVAAMEYVSPIQAWVDKPTALGGGGGAFGPFNIERLGLRADGTCALSGRQYVRLSDGSQLSIGSEGTPFIAWFPNGDCETNWNGAWEFHLMMTAGSQIDFVQCETTTSYSWSTNSCPAW